MMVAKTGAKTVVCSVANWADLLAANWVGFWAALSAASTVLYWVATVVLSKVEMMV